jgi:hypothetical protein
LEKLAVASSEKKTHTGEIDGPVACPLVQSLDANVLPDRLLGKLTMKLIVKLIEPVARKFFTQAQAEELFDDKVSDVQFSDQIADREVTFNQCIERVELEALYFKKKGLNIPFKYKCAFKRAIDYRSGINNKLLSLGLINDAIVEFGVKILMTVDRLPLSMGIYGTTYNRLFYESWTSFDSKNGFKSILLINNEKNAPGHSNIFNKFGAYPIEEREIKYDIMQRNGRAKSQSAQTG